MMDSTDMNASTHKGSLIGKRVRVNPVGAVNHFELVYGARASIDKLKVVYCTNRVNPNSLADQRTFMSARIHVSTIHHYILNPYGTLKDEISPPHHPCEVGDTLCRCDAVVTGSG